MTGIEAAYCRREASADRRREERTNHVSEAQKDLQDVIVEAAIDKLATDPVAVDVGNRLALAESFLIFSAPTDRQVRAIAEEIMDQTAKQLGVKPDRIEGRTGGTWVLIDYGELICHVLTDEQREFYALEKLWADGKVTHLAPEGEAARVAGFVAAPGTVGAGVGTPMSAAEVVASMGDARGMHLASAIASGAMDLADELDAEEE